MKHYIADYIDKNIKSITILVLCLVSGLVVGIITYQFLDDGIRNEFVNSMKSTLDITKQENFEGINVIKNGIGSNSIMVALIYLGAITLIAPFIVCIFNLFKGFVLGIYVCTIFNIFGFGNGLLSIFLIVLVPNIVYIPSFIYMCVNSINFHYDIIDNNTNKLGRIIKESYLILVGFSIMFLSVILEQFLSNVVISIYKNMG